MYIYVCGGAFHLNDNNLAWEYYIDSTHLFRGLVRTNIIQKKYYYIITKNVTPNASKNETSAFVFQMLMLL